MKQIITITLALLMSVASFGQKKELKTAMKAIEGNNFSAAITALSSAKPLIANAKDKYKAQYYLYMGQANYANGTTPANYDAAYQALNTLIGMNTKFTDQANTMLEGMKISYYTEASEIYKKASQLADSDPEQAAVFYNQSANQYLKGYEYSASTDHQALFQAANYFFYGGEYQKAIDNMSTLLETGYTGEASYYKATSVVNNQVKYYNSEKDMNYEVKMKIAKDPEVEKVPSQVKHMHKLLSLSHSKLGDNDKALEAIALAKEADPSDYGIIVTEANIYYAMGNKEMFKQKLEEAVAVNPNESSLFYNIGVMKMELGDTEGALISYKRAIELNPEYAEAYNNIGAIVLDKAKPIVEEMNNTKDFKKYGQLQEQQAAVLKEALPYFEKAYQFNPKELSVVQNLMGIYSNLEMDDKAAEMKAVYDTLK